jgi:hypothetical protein
MASSAPRVVVAIVGENKVMDGTLLIGRKNGVETVVIGVTVGGVDVNEVLPENLLGVEEKEDVNEVGVAEIEDVNEPGVNERLLVNEVGMPG